MEIDLGSLPMFQAEYMGLEDLLTQGEMTGREINLRIINRKGHREIKEEIKRDWQIKDAVGKFLPEKYTDENGETIFPRQEYLQGEQEARLMLREDAQYGEVLPGFPPTT